MPATRMLVDEFLPTYDVSDSVATVVRADVAKTWDALMHVDLIEVGRQRPLVAALGALRALPEVVSHLLHGEPPSRVPARLRLRDTAQIPAGEGGWVLLGERPRDEIALGLVGKFWRPVIPFATVTAEAFREFARRPRSRERRHRYGARNGRAVTRCAQYPFDRSSRYDRTTYGHVRTARHWSGPPRSSHL